MSWQEAQATHRRFPASRSNRGRRAVFDVRSAFGTYAVKCRGAAGDDGSAVEIHGSTDDGRGIVASFDMAGLRGVMLIAGSRKGLAEVVAAADAEGEEDEDEEEEEGDEEEEDEDKDDDDDDDTQVHSNNDDPNPSPNAPTKTTTHSKARASTSPTPTDNFAPPPPSYDAPAFEKNTFRTPKFWFRFLARDAATGRAVTVADDATGGHMGFLEFDGNACRRFKGVVSGERFGDNMPFEGWKVKGRGTPPARWSWKGFLREEEEKEEEE